MNSFAQCPVTTVNSVTHTCGCIDHVVFMPPLVFHFIQDSLRTLVQTSLDSFLRMIEDACHTTLSLPRVFEWDEPLNDTRFKSVLTTSW